MLDYTYSNNRVSAVSGSQNRRFTYDARGNVTNNGLRGFNFNLANQLTSSGALNFIYDGHDKLVKRTSNGSNFYQIYSQSGKLIHELHTDGSNTDYVYLLGSLVAKIKGNSTTYLHSDLLGSPRLETNENRIIVSGSRQHYQPYGKRIPSSDYTDIGFTGHKHDGDLGLTYMQARYYDPVIGRFYSNDPMDALSHLLKGNIHGFGRYTYGNNNPYKFTDPDGREAASAFDSFAKFFKSAETQTKNVASGLKATANQTGKGLENGAEFTKEFAKENLGNASTIAGVIPGGQVASLALAGADLLVNGDSSSAAGAIAATGVDAAKSDSGAVKVTTNKAQAIKAVGDWAVGVVVGTVATEVNKEVTEKMETDKK